MKSLFNERYFISDEELAKVQAYNDKYKELSEIVAKKWYNVKTSTIAHKAYNDTLSGATKRIQDAAKAAEEFANTTGDGTIALNQSLTNLTNINSNINNSKKTYLRLFLPNVAADAKTVCDYINKNYLLGQLSPAYTVEFDVVASNADWFSGVLSTDSTTLLAGRTVWGIVQQRFMSADNSTVYKYFAAGEGGAGSVSPFSSKIKYYIKNGELQDGITAIPPQAYTTTNNCSTINGYFFTYVGTSNQSYSCMINGIDLSDIDVLIIAAITPSSGQNYWHLFSNEDNTKIDDFSNINGNNNVKWTYLDVRSFSGVAYLRTYNGTLNIFNMFGMKFPE